MRELGYVDVVDFVERTTYAIWNDRDPELVRPYYPDGSVIWSDGGDLVGVEAVVADTRDALDSLPGFVGTIVDTIWTGDDEAGYRTSMRWISRGFRPGEQAVDGDNAGAIWGSCIANCVIVGGKYVEEWGVSPVLGYQRAYGRDVEQLMAEVVPTARPYGPEAVAATVATGATVPAIPAIVDGPGLLVVETLDSLFNGRDLDIVARRYAVGAPTSYGMASWDAGHDAIGNGIAAWHALLPDLHSEVEELYWNEDSAHRARVAVRQRLTGTALTAGGEREVSLTVISHLHVRGDQIVQQWVEYDDLALATQLGAVPLTASTG